MSRIILLIASLAVSIVLLGCSKTDDANSNKSAPGSSTSSSSSTPATAANTSGDKIGVPECDDFIAKYESCVSSKVPEVARAQYKTAVEQWKASWKKLADNPATKGSLAAACKQAADQQTAALKSFGCTF